MVFDKMILGEGVSVSMNCEKTGINNNVIVCGGSGSGKTMSVSEPLFLETFHKNLIATVTKRRIIDQYREMFQERGYDVMELNFANPEFTDISYDPLQYVRSYQDITQLAHAIIYANPKKEKTNTDPYWDDSAASLLSAEISLVLMTQKDPIFNDVLELHESLAFSEDHGGGVKTSIDEMIKAIEQDHPNCFAVTCWRTWTNNAFKTASCVYSFLNTSLDMIFNPEVRKMIGIQKKLNFKEIATKKTVLFVVTSPVNPSLNYLVNMFYGTAFKELFEFAEAQPSGKLPIPMHMLCDDFATGGRILNFPEYISIFREKQISVTLLLQSESQLSSMYSEDDAVSIINNCDSYIFMGCMDLQTCKNISLKLDVPASEVLWMPVGEIVVFRRGQRPVRTSRYSIKQNKVYRHIAKRYHEKISFDRG